MKLIAVLVTNLTGIALDWAVARCEQVEFDDNHEPIWFDDNGLRTPYRPSLDWAQGGPLIEREGMEIEPERADKVNGIGCITGWRALHPKNYGGLFRYSGRGDNLLEAAMRCYVASKLGDKVEVPLQLVSALPLDVLNKLWADLGDVPTVFEGGHVDEIEQEFLHFPVGTHRENIWRWFESMNEKFSVGEIMSGSHQSVVS